MKKIVTGIFIVLGFLILRLAFGQSLAVSQSNNELKVHFNLSGQLNDVEGKELAITFSDDMVALGGSRRGETVVSLTPVLKGEFLWRGTKTLVFKPSARFHYSTRYRVAIGAGISSLNGHAVKTPVQWEFITPLAKVVGFQPASHDYFQYVQEKGSRFDYIWVKDSWRLRFNQPVSVDEVGRRLTVIEKKSGGKAAFTIRAIDAAMVELFFPAPLQRSREYQVRLARGFCGQEGDAGTLRDMSFSVATVPPFRLESPLGENRLPCDTSPITLRFSNSLLQAGESILNEWIGLKLTRKERVQIPAYHLTADGVALDIILDEPVFPGDLLTVLPSSGISNDFGEQLGPVPEIHYRVCSAAEPSINVDFNQSAPKMSFKSIAAAEISLFKFKDELLFLLANRSDEYGDGESDSSFGFLEQVIAKQDLIERRCELRINGVDSAATVEQSLDLKAETGSEVGFFGILPRRVLPYNSCSPWWPLYYYPVRQPFHLQVELRRSFDFFIRSDLGRTLIWAYDKNSGLPVTAGQVTVGPENPLASVGVTGPDGLLAWPSELKSDDWVVVRRGHQGSDLAFSRIEEDTLERGSDLRLELLSDRDFYKPGDELFIGGLLREFRDGRLLSAASTSVRLRLLDPDSRAVLEKDLALDEWGGFRTSWISDVNGKRGRYVIEASAEGESRRLEVRIDYYQPNTFEVAIAPTTDRYLRRQTLTTTVSGDYLAGNPMAGDRVLYSLTAAPAAGDLAAAFGLRSGPAQDLSGFRFDLDEQLRKTDLPLRRQEKFDQAGKYKLSVPLTYFKTLNHAANLELSVTAQSAEGKEFSVAATALLFPGNRICGVRTPYYADAGKEISARLLLVDENGRPASGRVTLTLYRRDWNSGEWILKESGQPVSVMVTAEGMEHRFSVPAPGSYLLRADAVDDSGSVTSTSASFYAWSYSWGDNQDNLELRSESSSGRIGQTLTCYLQSPGEGQALITVETDRVVDFWTVPLRQTTPLAIKIKKEYFPVFKVRVAAALANGWFDETQKEFRVLEEGHRLRVDISAPETVKPASQQQMKVRVTDDLNRPCRAKVFIWAVDEGNLSLSNYRTPQWHDALYYRSPIDRSRSFRSSFNKSWNFQRPQLDINLGEQGFFGCVMRPDGTPVAGAKVILKKKGGKLAGQATSSAAGYYFVPGKFNGDYEISAEKDDLLSLPAFPDYQNFFGDLKSVDLVMVSREIAKKMAEQLAAVIEGGMAGGVEGGLMESIALPAPAAAEKRMAAQKKDEALDKSLITVRSDFREVLFFTMAETGTDGTASVEFKTSDQLSTYRLMAVAYAEESFGSNQKRLLVTKDLLLAEAMPEFARCDDRFSAGVQVSNRTPQAQPVQILAESRGIEINEPRRVQVNIAARSNQLVSFQFQANEAALAEITFYASAAAGSDGVLKKLAVTDNLVSESLLDFDSGKELSKRIQPPSQAKQAKLKLTVAPTILRPAGHIAQKLIFYPYECLEQRTSKVLPLLVLAPDLLAKMGVRVDLAQVREAVNGYLRIIPEFLASDGGLAYYRGSSWSSDYLTIYVLWALQLARQADYTVDSQLVSRLESRLASIKLSQYNEAFWQLVLGMNGKADAGTLRRLYADRLTLSLPARVFLYRALGFQLHDRERSERQKIMAAEFANGLQVEADFAYFDVAEFTYDRDLPFYSSRYATALMLQALLEWEADFPLAARVLNWLLEAPPHVWHTTQVNFWVLYAAAEYNRRVEKGGATRARIEWPGQAEEGRFASPQDTIVREKDLSRQQEEFSLRVSGDQPLYLTTELNYRLLRPGALSRGIEVQRLIYKEDGRLAEEFQQGSIYQVELLLDFSKEVPYAVVDEPLAAGFEVLRRDVATTRQLKEFNSAQAKAYATPWLRDEYQPDRIVFYSYGLGGKVRLTYFIKAIYAGRFTWLPTLVQGMYHPQYFGRVATREVVVSQPVDAEAQSR